jgi:amidophosphoribosyltransferase
VYFASAAPPVRYPNVYGIDMPAASELVAHARSEAEIGAEIGVDWLVYQDLEDLIESAREGNPSISRFECSVFNGQYVTNDVDHGYFERLESTRGQGARPHLLQAGEDVLGLYNSSRSQP